jgi:hypothetical protein
MMVQAKAQQTKKQSSQINQSNRRIINHDHKRMYSFFHSSPLFSFNKQQTLTIQVFFLIGYVFHLSLSVENFQNALN